MTLLRRKISLFLNRLWYGKPGFLNIFLSIFSEIYKIIISLRKYFYQKIYPKINFNIPVIIIGNITVGGTGKTPFIIWLSDFLTQHGYQVGIVSRGYGGQNKAVPYLVTSESDARFTGDEAVLLARRTQRPVVISTNRVKAVEMLLEKYPDCNIILSDDGLQHYKLSRQLEIVIIDGQRVFGNAYCLPAGPLREDLSRLEEVDFLIVNGELKNNIIKNYYAMKLISKQFYNIISPDLTANHEDFAGEPVHVVAGIGNPERFFNELTQHGLSVMGHAFPDHYAYTEKDFHFEPVDETRILMTEKDAVKCESFADYRYWYLPVSAVLPPELGEAILNKLKHFS